ncbi:MAG: hypothetical protein LBD04_09120 [Synergistaceae bacterium]|jgi:flagellin|nr:hypothetical protein [Synergistaceae bacterium]
MALVVNHNIPALQAYNAVNYTTSLLEKSIQKLSTGLRINSAADDAAGLAISEKMRAQIRGLDRATMNAQDGISMIQTAEGALNEVHSILQRMRELSVQAANDTLTQQDRAYIQEEVDQLREEVTRIGNTTQFNKKKLLDGSAGVIWSTGGANGDVVLGAKAVIHGGLRTIDQFGQKSAAEANLKITIKFHSGRAQILKTNIFTIKHTSAGQLGSVATGNTKLRDIQQFWNSEGRFLLEDPKTITVTLGNGTKDSFTLYGDDTLDSLVGKLNNLKNPTNKTQILSATYHAMSSTGHVPGTIEIRSLTLGSDGKMSFAGDEDVLKAFGLSVLQKPSEVVYSATVSNAHGPYNSTIPGSGPIPFITTGTFSVTGNRLIGLIHPSVDVIFSAFGVLSATGPQEYSFYLHLKDNTTVFQIGANEGEDMSVHIGDMRSLGLGLNGVIVTNREAAARSITIIDNAIDKVSTQRAKLGAYQNRLEHTINNLTVAGQNLTAAESRIRDTDMAKEMMNFTKLQILMQAGTSMLAQANAMPQNVLTLIR